MVTKSEVRCGAWREGVDNKRRYYILYGERMGRVEEGSRSEGEHRSGRTTSKL